MNPRDTGNQQPTPASENGGGLTRRQLLRGVVGFAAGLIGIEAFGALAGDAPVPDFNDAPGPPIAPHAVFEHETIQGTADLVAGGHWGWQPGAEPDGGGGINLSPTGLQRLDKHEGGMRHPDPPLNFALALLPAGDFAVDMHAGTGDHVALQLYGALPIELDDVRLERARMECLLMPDRLEVRVWDGTSQTPVVQAFSYPPDGDRGALEVQCIGSSIQFVVGSHTIGQLPHSILTGRSMVWLGLNSESSSAHVARLTARPLNGSRLERADLSTLHATDTMPDALQPLARSGFAIGTAIAPGPLVGDPRYAELALGDAFGSWTTENVMKPQSIQPQRGTFAFGPADMMVTMARQHGIQVHGHALVYDKAMPAWMAELSYDTPAACAAVEHVLIDHIKSVVGHFKGQVGSWDVLNEIFDGFGEGQVHLRDNIWLRALGPGYITTALRAAHEADPDALLFINDFGMETNPARAAAMVQLARELRAQGVPLHGIGIQGHVYEIPRDTIQPAALEALMQQCAAMGLLVRVSELDVTNERGPRAQADQYAAVLDVCLRNPNCVGLTFWGSTDAYGSTGRVDTAGHFRPGTALPVTADYRLKLAWRKMLEVLRLRQRVRP